jgi:hypothetical protein
MRAFYFYAHSCVIEIIGYTWEKFHNICDSKLGLLSLAKLNINVILYNFRPIFNLSPDPTISRSLSVSKKHYSRVRRDVIKMVQLVFVLFYNLYLFVYL